jgi:hypothetical protein
VIAPSFFGTQRSDPQIAPDACGSSTCPGKNGAKCSLTPIDPTPEQSKQSSRD